MAEWDEERAVAAEVLEMARVLLDFALKDWPEDIEIHPDSLIGEARGVIERAEGRG